MTDMLFCYITCNSTDEARSIADYLLKKKLAGCCNILPSMQSVYLWPPQSGAIEDNDEVVLIAKTIEPKYDDFEVAVMEKHSSDTPCVLSMPVSHVSKKYYDWIVGELK